MTSSPDFQSARSISYYAFWALFAGSALLEIAMPVLAQSPQAYIVSSLSMAIALLSWLHYDAKIQRMKISFAFKLGVFLLAILFFPIYLVRSRGWKHTFIGIGKNILILIGLSLLLGLLDAGSN